MGEQELTRPLIKYGDQSQPNFSSLAAGNVLSKPMFKLAEKTLTKPMFKLEPEYIPFCDEWIPEPEDMIFKQVKGAILLPVSKFYGIEDDTDLDYFYLDIKQRCYNSDEMRLHCTHYLNYFEKFFDQEKELVSIYYNMKYLIDYEPDAYNVNAFIYDLQKYILSPTILFKVRTMNLFNYSLSLNYKNNKNPGLQYNNTHGKILMEISVLMNIVIPLLTHYIKKHQKDIKIKDFLLYVFNIIISMYSDQVDIYSKIYETSITNIGKNRDNHPVLWAKQHIRGKNPTTHSIYTVNNIILQIIPKYTYNQNLVHFNYKSVLQNIKYQITDIAYEFQFISLSNSKRDEDNNSEFDKFETFQTKADESLYIQNKVNAEETMRLIDSKWGPFDDEEIEYYRAKMSTPSGELIINNFQKELVFLLFFNYFGDTQSIKAINGMDYIKLIIASRRILEVSGFVVLPYIISGKVNRLVTRKNINKKEMSKIEADEYYPLVVQKYRNNPKAIKIILGYIAIMLSSEFYIIDFNDTEELDGKKINVLSEYIIQEALIYALLI